jgi:hypothetical protein
MTRLTEVYSKLELAINLNRQDPRRDESALLVRADQVLE